MARRGRLPGQLVRCTCKKCGGIEMRLGAGKNFMCEACRPINLPASARAAVSKAVKHGEMRPARDFVCVDCGAPASHYEHRDYTKPLDVDPVCRPCNYRRGPAIGSHAMKRTTVYVMGPAGITHADVLARDLPDFSLSVGTAHRPIKPDSPPFGLCQKAQPEGATGANERAALLSTGA